MAGIVDIYLIYEFLRRLVTPFDQTQAYKLGLIDADGKRLKKAETQAERNAMGYYDRLVFNLKRLLATVPGGKSRIASFAAALLLLREKDERFDDLDYLKEELEYEISNLDPETYNYLCEEVAANAVGSGAGVAGLVGEPPGGRTRIGGLVRRHVEKVRKRHRRHATR